MVVKLIDIGLIVLYFLAVAIVGYFSAKKRGKFEYLIAGKKLSTWDNFATISASKISAGLIVTYVALVYVFGISAIWTFAGIAIGYVLFIPFALRLKKEGDINDYYSIADYFYHRYGVRTGRLVAATAFLILFFNFTIQLIAGAKVVNNIVGIGFGLAVFIMAIVILFYLYIGGFRAVVNTDSVQFVSIIFMFIVIGVFLFSNFTFDTTQWNLLSAGPILIIPLFLIGMLFPFSSPDLWQRSFAAKSVNSLKKSFVLAAILYVLFGFLLSLIAMIIRIKLPGIDENVALVQGFVHLLPPGFLGIGLVALLRR